MKNLGDYETESNQIPVVFKEFKDKIVLNIRVKNLMFSILVGKKKWYQDSYSKIKINQE